MTDKPKLFYTWGDIHSHVIGIKKRLPSGFTPKAIVGVSRGGLIPAVMLAHILKIREVNIIHATSYDDDNVKGKLEVFVDSKAQEVMRSKDTLIVDDIIDSGATYELIKFQWQNPLYYALIAKPMHLMHLAVGHVPHGTWVVFPWEQST